MYQLHNGSLLYHDVGLVSGVRERSTRVLLGFEKKLGRKKGESQ